MTADPRNYPVLSATLVAPAVAWLVARYLPGLELTDEQATIIAAVILAAGSGMATTMVRSRRSLPDPTTAVQVASRGTRVVEPTTYTPPAAKPHRRTRPPNDDPPPTGP
jgi:hypothetical protein